MASKGVTVDENQNDNGFGNPGVSGILHQKSSQLEVLEESRY